MEFYLSDKDQWLWVTADPIINEESRSVNAIHIVRDITNYKKIEIELMVHRENLEQKVRTRTRELKDKNVELQKRNKELEHYHQLFVEREFRIKELKNRVKELEKKS